MMTQMSAFASLLWRRRALLLLALANILLLAAYLWSRSGGSATIRIEAFGPEVRAFVDGKLVAETVFPQNPSGGIGFALPPNEPRIFARHPSIEWVRVEDRSGSVLYEDEFDGETASNWHIERGVWKLDGGSASSVTGGLITTGDRPWSDYVLTARISNAPEADVYLRAQGANTAIDFLFRPFFYHDAHLIRIVDGGRAEGTGGTTLELSKVESFRSMMATTLQPYPTAVLILLGLLMAGAALRLVAPPLRLEISDRLRSRVGMSLVTAVTVGTFALLWYVNYVVLDHMPHVSDEVIYVFQAKIFASFRLFTEAPQFVDHFVNSTQMAVRNGKWFACPPFGHPLLLALGVKVGAVWLVPPLVGAASVALLSVVGGHVYGRATGILAAILLLSSPFFQMTASNFMSHSTGAFYLLLALLFFSWPARRRSLTWFMAGVSLGLLLNTRPLAAAAVAPVFAAMACSEVLTAGGRRRAVGIEVLALGAGLALMGGLFLGYNWAVTGSPTIPPYEATGGITRDMFGFGDGYSLSRGLMKDQTQLAALVPLFNGWPAAFGLLFVWLPFALGTRNRWDYFLLANIVGIITADTFFRIVSFMQGPRYWYEMTPLLALLAARGVQRLVQATSLMIDAGLKRRREGHGLPTSFLTAPLAVGLVAALVAMSAQGWMMGQRALWPLFPNTPSTLSGLEGFNYSDNRLYRRVSEMGLHNALVLVRPCGSLWCYGGVFWRNTPDLDGDIVYAQDLGPEKNRALIAHYAGRSVYVAEFFQSTVEPYALP